MLSLKALFESLKLELLIVIVHTLVHKGRQVGMDTSRFLSWVHIVLGGRSLETLPVGPSSLQSDWLTIRMELGDSCAGGLEHLPALILNENIHSLLWLFLCTRGSFCILISGCTSCTSDSALLCLDGVLSSLLRFNDTENLRRRASCAIDLVLSSSEVEFLWVFNLESFEARRFWLYTTWRVLEAIIFLLRWKHILFFWVLLLGGSTITSFSYFEFSLLINCLFNYWILYGGQGFG